ncbi:MAG TPA: hypothetical protein VFF08_08180 [Trueperaceae bacterium]|nr:hypothetical protein [Trueperaceae bacterium]
MSAPTGFGGALRRAPACAGRRVPPRPAGRLAAALGLAAALLTASPAGAQGAGQERSWPDEPLTNLSHLESLTAEFDVEGERLLGVWIYAEPSPTDPDAYVGREAPGEGVTDLDDVARAVVAYLWHHEATGSERSLELARGLLGYVLAMQAEDGEFYNFVLADGRINRLGITSRKGAGFWAARALWALAEGMRAFADGDPAFAAELRQAFLRGVPPFEAKVAPAYGTSTTRHGLEAPAWLPDDGADVAANLLLGLSIFLQSEEHEGVRALHDMVAEGLMGLQYGPAGTYPFLAHMPFARDPLDWHAWGSRQTQALAQASRASADADTEASAAFLASAEAEAGHFFVHLLVDRGPYTSMNPAVRAYPQIAYGMEAVASGYFALADATGKTVYERLGGLMTGWLLGNNSLRQAMYDPATGRVYDGLERGVINRNAGAESTITGLMALVQAESRPAAREALAYTWLDAHAEFTVEAESGTDFGEAPATEVDGTASGQLAAVLKPGASLAVRAEVPATGRYLVYALHRDDPWEAGAAVFLGRERLGTVATTGAAESRYVMTQLGTVELEAGPISLTLSHAGGRDFRFDALLFRPVVEWKLYGREGSRLLLAKSWSPAAEPVTAAVVPALPANAAATAHVYDALANEVPSEGDLTLPPYGFALVEWPDDAPLPDLGLTTARVGPILALEPAFAEEGYVAVDLTPAFNADAFSLPSRPQRGNFDNRSGVYGATFPAELAPAASSRFEAAGVPFLFPPTDSELNNVVMLGQRLEVPAGRYAALHLLGSSDQGNYRSEATLVYEDGSSQTVTVGLSDWCQPPRYGETVAVEFAQRRGTSGQVERITCRILHQTVPVDPERVLVRVDLPDRETMHLFALTLAAPSQE